MGKIYTLSSEIETFMVRVAGPNEWCSDELSEGVMDPISGWALKISALPNIRFFLHHNLSMGYAATELVTGKAIKFTGINGTKIQAVNLALSILSKPENLAILNEQIKHYQQL